MCRYSTILPIYFISVVCQYHFYVTVYIINMNTVLLVGLSYRMMYAILAQLRLSHPMSSHVGWDGNLIHTD